MESAVDALGMQGWVKGGWARRQGADLSPGSAVFILRTVRRSSFKRMWRELASSGRYHRALPARGQGREVMRCERGTGSLIFFRPELGGHRASQGRPGELDAVSV